MTWLILGAASLVALYLATAERREDKVGRLKQEREAQHVDRAMAIVDHRSVLHQSEASLDRSAIRAASDQTYRAAVRSASRVSRSLRRVTVH